MNFINSFFTNPAVVGAAAVSAALVAVVALFIAWRTHEFSKKVADAQKIFEPSCFELSLFGQLDIDMLVIAAPLKKNTVLTTNLQISIANTGKTSLHEAQLVVRANKELSWGEALDKKTYPEKQVYGELRMEDEEQMRKFIFNFEKPLYAGFGITVQLPLTLRHRTRVVGDKMITASDNQRLKMSYSIWFDWTIDVVLFSDEEKPIAKRLRLQVIDTLLEKPLEAINAITSKDIEDETNSNKMHPFLYVEITQDQVQPGQFSGVFSRNIDSKDIRIGFFDPEGGQVMGTSSPEKPLRLSVEKLRWLQSHGYKAKLKK